MKILQCKLLFMLCSLLCLGACVPAVVGTGAAGSKMAVQEKTIGESISDTTIWAKTRASFMKHDIDGLLGSVNVEVNEGRVLLTGAVDSKESIIKILRIIWQQNGVKDVINELKIIPTKERPGVLTYTKDSWMTTQAKTKMLMASHIKSVNYGVETIGGTVYLFGIGGTDEEVEEVKDIISSVDGVKEVISYVRVRKDLYSRVATTKGKGSPIAKSSVKIDEQEELSDDDIFEDDSE